MKFGLYLIKLQTCCYLIFFNFQVHILFIRLLLHSNYIPFIYAPVLVCRCAIPIHVYQFNGFTIGNIYSNFFNCELSFFILYLDDFFLFPLCINLLYMHAKLARNYNDMTVKYCSCLFIYKLFIK